MPQKRAGTALRLGNERKLDDLSYNGSRIQRLGTRAVKFHVNQTYKERRCAYEGKLGETFATPRTVFLLSLANPIQRLLQEYRKVSPSPHLAEHFKLHDEQRCLQEGGDR